MEDSHPYSHMKMDTLLDKRIELDGFRTIYITGRASSHIDNEHSNAIIPIDEKGKGVRHSVQIEIFLHSESADVRAVNHL